MEKTPDWCTQKVCVCVTCEYWGWLGNAWDDLGMHQRWFNQQTCGDIEGMMGTYSKWCGTTWVDTGGGSCRNDTEPSSYQVTYAMIAMLGKIHMWAFLGAHPNADWTAVYYDKLIEFGFVTGEKHWETVLSSTAFDWPTKTIAAALGPVTGSFGRCSHQSARSVHPLGTAMWRPVISLIHGKCCFAPHTSWLVIHLATTLGTVSIQIIATFFIVLSWWYPYIPHRPGFLETHGAWWKCMSFDQCWSPIAGVVSTSSVWDDNWLT